MSQTHPAIDKLMDKLEAVSGEVPMRKRNRAPTKKDVVLALAPRIKTMLRGDAKKRWSHADVVAWLGQQGVTISMNTFGQYMRAYERIGKTDGNAGAVPKVPTPKKSAAPVSEDPPSPINIPAPPKADADVAAAAENTRQKILKNDC